MENLNYAEGADLAVENSTNLLIAAGNTAENKQFGLANTLAILSAEEAIKGILCFRKHYFPDKEIPGFKKMFRDHEFKHKQIVQSLQYMDIIIASYREMVPRLQKLFNASLVPGDPESEEANSRFDGLNKYIQEIDAAPDEYSSEEIVKWWKEANDYKNNGLYVGIDSDKWRTPNQISEEQWSSSSYFCDKLIRQAVALKAIGAFQEVIDKLDAKYSQDH